MDAYLQQQLLFFLKAIAEENRLAILRSLFEGERNVGELARQIDLGEPTVSHHLSKLREVGLVNLRMEGNQRFYRGNASGIAQLKRLVAMIDQPAPPQKQVDMDDSWITELGWEAADEEILRKHTRGHKLVRTPTKQKALIVILRWLATRFEAGRLYSEVEVNETIKSIFEPDAKMAGDYVSLRRDLVDLGYLRRERGGGKYWLAPEESDAGKP